MRRLLTAFVNVLPNEAALRVWDIMLFERNPCILFRVMLKMIDGNVRTMMGCTDALGLWVILAQLPARFTDASALIDGAMLEFKSLNRCLRSV